MEHREMKPFFFFLNSYFNVIFLLVATPVKLCLLTTSLLLSNHAGIYQVSVLGNSFLLFTDPS